MPISISKYLGCHNGATKIIDFNERPICRYCNRLMKIVKTLIIGPIVGLLDNYDVQIVYYQYGKAYKG